MVFVDKTIAGPLLPSSAEELIASEVYQKFWYYSIELLPGIFTRGMHGAAALTRRLLERCNIKDLRCLDIGPMEGLVSAYLAHQGAKAVTAIDITLDHISKINAVKHYHNIEIDFHAPIPLKDAPRFFRGRNEEAFDLVVCSGVLYHVLDFTASLASARALVREGGIMIVETWLSAGEQMSMSFNAQGAVTAEQNTFWFPTVPLFEYLLRMQCLEILDCLFYEINGDEGGGYRMACTCRAIQEPDAGSDDNWMIRAGLNSVDAHFYREAFLPSPRKDNVVVRQVSRQISVLAGSKSLDLLQWVKSHSPVDNEQSDMVLKLPRTRSYASA